MFVLSAVCSLSVVSLTVLLYVQGYEKVNRNVLDDTKWGWRTIDGQAELQDEVMSNYYRMLILVPTSQAVYLSCYSYSIR